MQILAWQDWLDKHIPYYEAERFRNLYAANPPADMLVIKTHEYFNADFLHKTDWWEDMNNKVHRANGRVEAFFLQRDTRQEWYFGFWKKGEALFWMLKHS